MIEPDETSRNPEPIHAAVLGYAEPSSMRRAGVRASRVIAWTVLSMLGLFVIAGLLVLPSTGHAREAAQRIKCASNLKQIGLSLQLYAQANAGVLPPSFDELFATSDLTSEVFVCPSSNDVSAIGPTTQALIQQMHLPGHCSYVYALPPGTLMTSLTAQHVVAFDLPNNHPAKDGQAPGMNVLYGDGTVSLLSLSEGQRVISELQAGFNPPRPPTTQPTGR